MKEEEIFLYAPLIGEGMNVTFSASSVGVKIKALLFLKQLASIINLIAFVSINGNPFCTVNPS